VSFEGGRYSVPHQLAGQAVWARRHVDNIVIIHAGPGGPAEVARHLVTSPGSPSVQDAHYPPAPADPAASAGTDEAEAEFPAIGDGAGLWLTEAAAAGASRVRAKMAKAVQLSRLHSAADVDRAPGRAGPQRTGSATTTWTRSWPTRRPPEPGPRHRPARITPSPRARDGGPRSAAAR
jgi:hypothetical protein